MKQPEVDLNCQDKQVDKKNTFDSVFKIVLCPEINPTAYCGNIWAQRGVFFKTKSTDFSAQPIHPSLKRKLIFKLHQGGGDLVEGRG